MNVFYVYALPGDTRYGLVRSPRWTDARAFLLAEGIHAMWSPVLRGWCLRSDRLADFTAAAEHAGWTIQTKGTLRQEAGR